MFRMVKIYSLGVVLTLFFWPWAWGAQLKLQENKVVRDAPLKVKTGLFITQLGDFEMAKRSFTVTFWSWFIHNSKDYDPLKTVETVNAKTDSIKFSSTDHPGRAYWQQQKHTATIAQDWDVSHFPFDRQQLKIVLEDGVQSAEHVTFVPDLDASGIDPSIVIPGWRVEKFELITKNHVYPTTFGDPTLNGSSEYAQTEVSVTIRRDGGRLVISMYIGFWVALLLAILTYFLDMREMLGTRVGLCTGALFCAVGNKYSIDNALSPVAVFTLTDLIVSVAFLAISMAVFTVVFVEIFYTKYPKMVKTVNLIFGLITALSIALVFGFVISYSQS